MRDKLALGSNEDGQRSVPPALIAFVWIASGGNFAAFALGVQTIPPFLLTSSRMLLAGGLMLASVLWLDRSLFARFRSWPTRKQVISSLTMSFLMLVMAQTSVVWSVQKMPAGVAAIISASMPIWVGIMDVVFGGVHPSRRTVAGIILGFMGLLLLFLSRSAGRVDGLPLVPALVTLAGTIGGAVGIVFGRRADMPDNVFCNTGIQLVGAGAALLGVSLATGELTGFELGRVSTASLGAWTYMLFISSMLGFPGLVWLAKNARPAVASTFAYVGPVVGLGTSVWLLGETLTTAKLFAAALSLGGAFLMVSSPAVARDKVGSDDDANSGRH